MVAETPISLTEIASFDAHNSTFGNTGLDTPPVVELEPEPEPEPEIPARPTVPEFFGDSDLE